ncbi:MAG: NAD(P)H-binding protein, partial [Candidatus Binataceae bacterium]
GATGDVGGRLARALEARGERVRCVARRPEYLRGRIAPAIEVVQGDVQNRASLERAMAGVDCAYYMVHSMGGSDAFAREDREGAANFAAAANGSGVRRIIYLGGLDDSRDELSEHLASRHEVGEVLRGGGVPVIEFRASLILGSGSLSFEMIRALAERLQLMVTPRWVSIAAQPISIGEVIQYLIGALDFASDQSRVFEIGGADVVSYADILREYARQRGIRCVMIPVPVLTPRLSSLWLALVTPLYARVGRKLIDSITYPTVVREPGAVECFGVRPL